METAVETLEAALSFIKGGNKITLSEQSREVPAIRVVLEERSCFERYAEEWQTKYHSALARISGLEAEQRGEP